jgi:hypothetical protein
MMRFEIRTCGLVNDVAINSYMYNSSRQQKLLLHLYGSKHWGMQPPFVSAYSCRGKRWDAGYNWLMFPRNMTQQCTIWARFSGYEVEPWCPCLLNVVLGAYCWANQLIPFWEAYDTERLRWSTSIPCPCLTFSKWVSMDRRLNWSFSWSNSLFTQEVKLNRCLMSHTGTQLRTSQCPWNRSASSSYGLYKICRHFAKSQPWIVLSVMMRWNINFESWGVPEFLINPMGSTVLHIYFLRTLHTFRVQSSELLKLALKCRFREDISVSYWPLLMVLESIQE